MALQLFAFITVWNLIPLALVAPNSSCRLTLHTLFSPPAFLSFWKWKRVDSNSPWHSHQRYMPWFREGSQTFRSSTLGLCSSATLTSFSSFLAPFHDSRRNKGLKNKEGQREKERKKIRKSKSFTNLPPASATQHLGLCWEPHWDNVQNNLPKWSTVVTFRPQAPNKAGGDISAYRVHIAKGGRCSFSEERTG